MEKKSYQKDRDRRISARINKAEQEMIERKAKAKGMSITDYLVTLVNNDKEQ